MFETFPNFNKEIFDSFKETFREQTFQKFNSISVICEKEIYCQKHSKNCDNCPNNFKDSFNHRKNLLIFGKRLISCSIMNSL